MDVFKKEFDSYIYNKNSISEECIEKALIYYLCNKLGYVYRTDIKNADQLKQNFRHHYEKLNNYAFNDKDFESFWITFNSGNVYDRFITLKSKPFELKNKGEPARTFKYFDYNEPEKNVFEVVNQLWVKDNTEGLRRFDINILINGIPIIHIELKRESCDLHQAGRQIRKYKEIEAISNFLNFTKLYVLSNGSKTLYISNNEEIDHNFAFKWTDEKNVPANEIIDFSQNFLKKNFILDFIKNYYVYDESKKIVKIFRPYQYHASRLIIERVLANKSNKDTSGYVWHATGSGKTMTSFKVCEMLANLKTIDRTIFLIDRIDLNTQTFDNFKSFTTSKTIVKNATDSDDLVDLLCNSSSDKQIIITTIQKLNNALSNDNSGRLNFLKNKKIVFMVDEGHRSQLGLMRKKINQFFTNAINFGFTGTPIFDRNAVDGKTTQYIFGEMIHKYTSYNAISDNNVLPLTLVLGESVKSQIMESDTNFDDDLSENIGGNIEVDKGRIEEIVKYIINEYPRLTKNNTFNAILACSSIPEAMAYYDMFELLDDKLKKAVIFSYNKSDNSNMSGISQIAEDFILKRIKEHNSTWDLQSFSNYKTTIQNEFSKDRKYDLLIVVAMFLTGFDSPITNTLFLDKKLRYHNLVQAISRTNRIHSNKDTGYIVSFKTTKDTFDEALTLYTNGGINTPLDPLWTMQTYEQLSQELANAINNLVQRFPNVDDVINLTNDEQKLLNFLDLFKKLNGIINKINPMPEFNWTKFDMDKRTFDKYRGAYLDRLEASANDKNIIYTYNDYAIVTNGIFKIDKDYLIDLLDSVVEFNINGAGDFRESDFYAMIKQQIIEKSGSRDEKELLEGFLDEENIFEVKTFEEIKNLWYQYIMERIENVEQRAMHNWKTTSKAIRSLLEQFKIKKHLNNFDFISKILPEYVKNELDDDEKLAEIQNIVIKLSVLHEIKRVIL